MKHFNVLNEANVVRARVKVADNLKQLSYFENTTL